MYSNVGSKWASRSRTLTGREPHALANGRSTGAFGAAESSLLLPRGWSGAHRSPTPAPLLPALPPFVKPIAPTAKTLQPNQPQGPPVHADASARVCGSTRTTTCGASDRPGCCPQPPIACRPRRSLRLPSLRPPSTREVRAATCDSNPQPHTCRVWLRCRRANLPCAVERRGFSRVRQRALSYAACTDGTSPRITDSPAPMQSRACEPVLSRSSNRTIGSGCRIPANMACLSMRVNTPPGR